MKFEKQSTDYEPTGYPSIRERVLIAIELSPIGRTRNFVASFINAMATYQAKEAEDARIFEGKRKAFGWDEVDKED